MGFCRSVQVAELTLGLGDMLELAVQGDTDDDESDLPPLGLLQALRQTPSGAKEAQVSSSASRIAAV